MEVDHFRPWSRTEFRHLRDDPTNFHHSCGRCNRLKASYWPAGGVAATHDGRAGFVDPFADDRREYFAVTSDGSLTCKKHPASYLVRLLQLNRPLLRMLRVRRMLRVEIHSYIDRMEKEFVASRDGAGLMTREELAIAALEVLEYHRLLDLCDWPLQRSVGC